MLICDTHADTLYALASGQKTDQELDVTMQRLQSPGHTRVQALALFVGTSGLRGAESDLIQRELQVFQRFQKQGWRQILTVEEARAGEANALLTIEGGEAFGDDPLSVEAYAQQGVRIAAPVWNHENLLAYPAVGGEDQGLKPLGWKMIREMRRLRIAVDVSHLNARGFWELLESDVPPMASHSCAKALCDHPRNLSDRQLRSLFAVGGYVGVAFYPSFLSPTGEAGIQQVIDHIQHMCDLGGERCVGLGSDFDGIERYPQGLRHAGELPALLEAMEKRGFSPTQIENVAGENFARYLLGIDRG